MLSAPSDHRRVVHDDQFRAPVSYGLADLFCGVSLFFLRLPADQHDRFRVADVVMRAKRRTQIRKKGGHVVLVRYRNVARADHLLGEDPKREYRFVG